MLEACYLCKLVRFPLRRVCHVSVTCKPRAPFSRHSANHDWPKERKRPTPGMCSSLLRRISRVDSKRYMPLNIWPKNIHSIQQIIVMRWLWDRRSLQLKTAHRSEEWSSRDCDSVTVTLLPLRLRIKDAWNIFLPFCKLPETRNRSSCFWRQKSALSSSGSFT